MRKVYEKMADTVTVSVVIPSSDGDRGGNVAKLMDDLRAQSFRDFEVIMIIGVTPQGKAINIGAADAAGEFLLILDDDSRVADPDVIGRMIEAVKTMPDVGMAGASIVQPSDATPFQRRVAREFPRFNMPVVSEVTDSDMACHGCCAFRKSVFDEIGGEPENIVRGLDPVVRQKLRDCGYRVVLLPDMKVSHPVPGSWTALMKMFFRNGRGSAYARRHMPGKVYDTSENVEWKGESLSTPFIVRMIRFPLRTVSYLFRGRFFRFAGDIVYTAGYIYETFI